MQIIFFIVKIYKIVEFYIILTYESYNTVKRGNKSLYVNK